MRNKQIHRRTNKYKLFKPTLGLIAFAMESNKKWQKEMDKGLSLKDFEEIISIMQGENKQAI